MTDAAYLAWLQSASAIRVVLIEVVVNVAGTDITRYLSTRPYVTGASDTPANTAYLPRAANGIQYTESISLTSDASMTQGDIELNNQDGALDSWLLDVWAARPIQAFIGDPRWVRSDFRLIFNGIVDDIHSKSRDTINIVLRDKLQRLNTPVSEVVLGGTTPNQAAVIPLTFGECHNVTPLLTNPATLEYQVHNGPVERCIEVRDNGIPVTATVTASTGKFTLAASPAGAVTVSVQGDKPSVYYNTISRLVQRIVQNYGKASDQFASGDLDASNLAAFEIAHPQPVGIYLHDRENVLSTIQTLAASIGAQVVMSRAGQLRLIQIALPPAGTPTVITEAQMVQRTLQVVDRPTVVASVQIGFCKNWTVQAGLQTAIPAQHKDLFAQEWLTSIATDATVQTKYKLNALPVQQDTLLLTRTDAATEAARKLALVKVARTVYQFEGTADLLLLELGNAVTLYNHRFGLSGGVTGMVVSLAPDWMTGHVTVGVLV